MKNLLLFPVSVCTLSLLCQSAPAPFSPIIRSYSVLDYSVGNENRTIAQSGRGVMYSGSNSGLFRYDRSRWKPFPLPAPGTVRTVYVVSDGRICVGSSEEFGYFEKNDLNLLEYHPLKNQVKGFDFYSNGIWIIVEQGGNIVFQSFGSYFIYDGMTAKGVRYHELSLNLFQVGNMAYSQLISAGACVFTDDRFTPLISRQELGNSNILVGSPYSGGMLLLARNGGGYSYNSSDIHP